MLERSIVDIKRSVYYRIWVLLLLCYCVSWIFLESSVVWLRYSLFCDSDVLQDTFLCGCTHVLCDIPNTLLQDSELARKAELMLIANVVPCWLRCSQSSKSSHSKVKINQCLLLFKFPFIVALIAVDVRLELEVGDGIHFDVDAGCSCCCFSCSRD